jgi:uncharacterized RDD family membrane protein YckC
MAGGTPIVRIGGEDATAKRKQPVAGKPEAQNEALIELEEAGGGKESRSDEDATIEVGTPLSFEWLRDAGGKESWKVTCLCGKRLLTPASPVQPYGRCPKCGRRLILPGYAEAAKERPKAAAAELLETLKRVNLHAAHTAAKLLRPRHSPGRLQARRRGSGLAIARCTASGRVSAWPLAGLGRRLLAAFIDFSLCSAITGVLVAAGGKELLEQFRTPLPLLLALLLLALIFNDTVIHLLWGGSIGKNLVLLAVQGKENQSCGVWRLLLRAILKWLLIPGWIVSVFNPTERAAHDLLAGTVVLRARRRGSDRSGRFVRQV